MGIGPRQGKSRTDCLVVCDKGYIICSISTKIRPRFSGRPPNPWPIRLDCGSHDKPGRSTNKHPEPIPISPKHKGSRFLNKSPLLVQDKPKYRPLAISGQHPHWTQVACLTLFGHDFVHLSWKIRPKTACTGGG